MEKEFVPYEQALELKELGFDEPCFGLYAPPSKTVFLHHYGLLRAKEQVLAPLYQQAFRWFREKYGVFTSIVPSKQGSLDYFIGWIYVPSNGTTRDINVGDYSKGFSTPEEAELACLRKLIEIVKKK